MNEWVWITLGVLVLAAGISLQAYMLAAKTRDRRRKSIRARRAEHLRAQQFDDAVERGDDTSKEDRRADET